MHSLPASSNRRRGPFRTLLRRLTGQTKVPDAVWGVVRVREDGVETPLYWCSTRRTARRMARTPSFKSAGRLRIVPRAVSSHVENLRATLERLNWEAQPHLESLLRRSLGPKVRREGKIPQSRSTRGSISLL